MSARRLLAGVLVGAALLAVGTLLPTQIAGSDEASAGGARAAAEVTLTVNKTGNGTVKTVGSNDIDCGNDCSEPYDYDAAGQPTQVTLTAEPDPYEDFHGWGGECGNYTRQSDCTLEMTKNRIVSATFTGPSPSPSPSATPTPSPSPSAAPTPSPSPGGTIAAKPKVKFEPVQELTKPPRIKLKVRVKRRATVKVKGKLRVPKPGAPDPPPFKLPSAVKNLGADDPAGFRIKVPEKAFDAVKSLDGDHAIAKLKIISIVEGDRASVAKRIEVFAGK